MDDKLTKAEKLLSLNPYDIDGWSILIRHAQSLNVREARPTYERLITQFPSCGKYWQLYIEHELSSQNLPEVEKLFQRCLTKVLNIDLWKTYLNYVRTTKCNQPNFREQMASAYDFALERIGIDYFAIQIYIDYINFLKGVEAVGSYAENQKITAVRRVFQRGVVTPMVNVETLWSMYVEFEKGINELIAKKMQDERGRFHVNAKRVAKELDSYLKGLNRTLPACPPTNTSDEVQQVRMWKRYIAWEKMNPMHSEDYGNIVKRVIYAYEQCLLCLAHHPDVWYEASAFLELNSRTLTEKGDQNAGKTLIEEAAALYERAISTFMKKCPMLYFAFADFEETRMKYDKVHQIYKRLLEVSDIDPTLAYVQYMKFARRAEGIKNARNIFKLAREDERSKHQVFVAAALMEYYCGKDKNVAFRIFELGLKKFGSVPQYVLAFIDYMTHLNEDNNTRVVFERVLSSNQLELKDSVEVWNRFLTFESQVGDLPSIVKVEKRRETALSSLENLEHFETALLVDRYCYLDLSPLTASQLKSVGYHYVSAVVSAPSTGASAGALQDAADRADRASYPMPDLSQMLPYKPRRLVPPEAHILPGGVYPVPPAIAHLLALCPPPDCFHGPFVNVDQFMDMMRVIQLPPTEAEFVQLWNALPAAPQPVDLALRKRPADSVSSDADDAVVGFNSAAVASDLYSVRKQKKVSL